MRLGIAQDSQAANTERRLDGKEKRPRPQTGPCCLKACARRDLNYPRRPQIAGDQIPASIPPTKLEVDTALAIAQVDTFIAGVRARSVSINVRADLPDVGDNKSGLSRPCAANGGTIGALADGGTGGGTVNGPGTAFSDTAGMYRLANGEEVISNKFGQADRNRQLLKAINAGQTFTVGATHAPTQQSAPSGGTTKMISYSPTFTQVVGTSQAVDNGLRRLSMLRS